MRIPNDYEKHIELTNILVNAQDILLYYRERKPDEMVQTLNLSSREAEAERIL